VVRAFQRLLPVTTEFAGGQFTVVRCGRRFATPLLLALVAVEVTDLIFAVDSVPAIFAVTTDPFIVFTSNIFAILGLRSLFFLLAAVITRFVYLKVGLSLVLMFVGAKMLVVDVYKLPITVSLGIISGILALSMVASFLRRDRRPAPRSGGPVPRPKGNRCKGQTSSGAADTVPKSTRACADTRAAPGEVLRRSGASGFHNIEERAVCPTEVASAQQGQQTCAK